MRRELTVITRKRIECGVACLFDNKFFKTPLGNVDEISVQSGEIFPTKLPD